MFDKLLERCVNEMKKLFFLGTCENIVNTEDSEAVSALAVLVEEGEEITKDDFLTVSDMGDEHLEMLNSNPDNFEFYYNYDENIAWFYSKNEDVEYFYGLSFPI